MKIKNIILCSLVGIILIAIIIFTGFPNRNITKANSVYQVYLDGEKLGVIADENELYDLINREQAEIKGLYNVENVYPPNGFDIVEYNTYNGEISDVKSIYSKIKDEKSFTIKGYAVSITGERQSDASEEDSKTEKIDLKLYVLDEEIFKTATSNVVNAFVDAKKLNDYLNDSQPDIKNGGSIIKNIKFDEDITIKETYIDADEKIYTNAFELSQYLLFGNEGKKETYTVKKGDTIDSIAFDHQLNTVEFLLANPRFTSENDLLAIQDEVVIALINPVLTLTAEMEVVEDIEEEYDTEVKYDNTKYSSYKVTTQKGEKGVKRITKLTRVVNGEENQGAVITDSETIKEPVTEIITRGRKSGSSNNGQYVDNNLAWAWPTNTPYTITSRYGYRWGRLHDGLDISGTGYGSPIYSSAAGTVINSGTGGLGGWSAGICIVIDHHNGYYTMYAHLSKTLVKVGDVVTRKQIIGLMGNTGSVSPRPTKSNPLLGTHLHFTVFQGYPYAGGRTFNPEILWR